MDQSSRHATLDWTAEDEYWRANYGNRPYNDATRTYDYWQPAYRYGYDASQRYQNRKWEDVESDLQRDWERYEHRRDTRSTWEQVKGAVRDAWDRIVGHK